MLYLPMFFKVVKSKGFEYLKLVETYWQDGKAHQRVIANLGRLDVLRQSGQLQRLTQRLKRLSGDNSVNYKDLKELNRYCYGDIVYRRLWQQYRLDTILGSLVSGKRVQFDFIHTVYLLVIDRLLQPRSKLATWQSQGRYLCLQEVSLSHLYRSLDILAEGKQQLEGHLFSRYMNLFNHQVDVVFYDVSTYHFESVRGDELRRFGYSKAGKFNEVQVVMGLLLDMAGHPIGFDLFPGNTHDVQTFVQALQALEERFRIRRLIFVADQGLNSAANLYALQQAGYEYIVRARLKQLPSALQEQVLDTSGYVPVKGEGDEDVGFRYKRISGHRFVVKDSEGHRQEVEDSLIVYWSEKLAERDRQNRQRLVEKAQQLVHQRRQPGIGKGHQRYLALEGRQRVVGIDEARIAKDASWDGYLAVQSNVVGLDSLAIIDAYHQLWRIEEAFRLLKSTLRTRPIFHWTPRRILGHFVVCFIAFVLERALEIRLKRQGISASPEQIRRAINSLEISEVQLGEHVFYLKGKHEPLAGKIFKVLKLKHLKNVMDKKELPQALGV